MRRLSFTVTAVLTVAAFAVPTPAAAPAGSIPFRYVEQERARVYSPSPYDFDTWGELKSRVKAVLDDFECPRCKGHQCRGDQVYFQVRKVDIYQEVERPRLLGGTKKVDQFVKTAWRIEGMYLRQRDGGFGILSDESEGYIECQRSGCGWSERGGVKPRGSSGIKWISINDLLRGNW